MHLNIRSIDRHHEELCAVIENLNKKPDIIICGETWSVSRPNFYNISGYNLFYNHGSVSIADGLIVYVKVGIIVRPSIKDLAGAKALVLEIRGACLRKTLLTAIYRPHAVDKTAFVDGLRGHLRDCSRHDNHILVGDINLNLLNINADGNVEDYMNNLLEFGFSSLINGVTRPDSGSCLDHIFCKSRGTNPQAYIARVNITDHYPVFVDLDLREGRRTETSVSRTSLDYEKLKHLSGQIRWEEVMAQENVNECTDMLVSKIKEVMDLATTVKRV